MNPALGAAVSTVLWGAGVVAFLVSTVWLSVVDLATQRLPNRLVLGTTVVTLGLLAAAELVMLPTLLAAGRSGGLRAWQGLLMLALGALLLLGLFALLWRVAPGGIGGGDVKIAPLIGGTLGLMGGLWAVLGAVLIAALCAAIWSAMRGAALRRRRSTRASVAPGSALSDAPPAPVEPVGIPFAPCLFAGAWIAIAIGPLAARLF
ncbi:prepilin peptidase [Leucobacter sp. GX0328]